MTYGDYGYLCADSMLPELIELGSQSTSEWAGIELDSEKVARHLAILCLAFHYFSSIGLLSEVENSLQLLGLMRRFDERFSGFSSDRLTVEATTEYIRVAAADLKNESKKESFPTLVPMAISRITGLSESDSHWHSAEEVIYAILETILKTAHQSLERMKTVDHTNSDDFRLSNINMWTEVHHPEDGGSVQRMRLKDGNAVVISVSIATVKVFVTPLEITDLTQFKELKEFELPNGWWRHIMMTPDKRYAEDLLILDHLRRVIAWPASVDELSATLHGMDATLQVNT